MADHPEGGGCELGSRYECAASCPRHAARADHWPDCGTGQGLRGAIAGMGEGADDAGPAVLLPRVRRLQRQNTGQQDIGGMEKMEL